MSLQSDQFVLAGAETELGFGTREYELIELE